MKVRDWVKYTLLRRPSPKVRYRLMQTLTKEQAEHIRKHGLPPGMDAFLPLTEEQYKTKLKDDVMRLPTTDQQMRASAIKAACTLCSGALSLNSLFDESDLEHITKVGMVAELLMEYIKHGTMNGMNMDPRELP